MFPLLQAHQLCTVAPGGVLGPSLLISKAHTEVDLESGSGPLDSKASLGNVCSNRETSVVLFVKGFPAVLKGGGGCTDAQPAESAN